MGREGKHLQGMSVLDAYGLNANISGVFKVAVHAESTFHKQQNSFQNLKDAAAHTDFVQFAIQAVC